MEDRKKQLQMKQQYLQQIEARENVEKTVAQAEMVQDEITQRRVR